MKKQNGKSFRVYVVLIIASLLGCAGGTRGGLPLVKNPTESELKQNWNEYVVFFRKNLAFVYKLKDDKKIILDDRWVEISAGDVMAKSEIWDTALVRKIIGLNGQMYGYLVQRAADNANVKIINADTVQLYYHYVRTSGGP